MSPRILKKKLPLNEFQQQVLAGYLLGDGCIETWKSVTKQIQVARLKVEQSLTQVEFVNWLFEIFKEFIKTPPKSKKHNIYFNTLSSNIFYEFHKMFYQNHKKVIPENIEQLLTPISFTVWFMSDGSVKSKECNGRILNTHGFTEIEVTRLCQILNQKFDLITSIRRQKDGLQIYISAKSAGVLTKLISPHLLPYFIYKLPNLKVNRLPKE